MPALQGSLGLSSQRSDDAGKQPAELISRRSQGNWVTSIRLLSSLKGSFATVVRISRCGPPRSPQTTGTPAPGAVRALSMTQSEMVLRR